MGFRVTAGKHLRDDADGLEHEEAGGAAEGISGGAKGGVRSRGMDARAEGEGGEGAEEFAALGAFSPASSAFSASSSCYCCSANSCFEYGRGAVAPGLKTVAEELVPPAAPGAGETFFPDFFAGAEEGRVEPGVGVVVEDAGAEELGEKGEEKEDGGEGEVGEGDADQEAAEVGQGVRRGGGVAGKRPEVWVAEGDVFEDVEGEDGVREAKEGEAKERAS